LGAAIKNPSEPAQSEHKLHTLKTSFLRSSLLLWVIIEIPRARCQANITWTAEQLYFSASPFNRGSLATNWRPEYSVRLGSRTKRR
jgi:hypothetical protein